jgi:RHS repeat-associated protein
LVTGTGSTDNAAFSVVGNQLKINASPDFETKSSYSIRVRTTDQGGLSYEKTLTISVTDVNEAPTNLVLSNNITPENVIAGSVLGTLTTTDPDASSTFTYSLVAGTGSTDNAAFSVIGNQLKINASPDFETKSSYSIRVRTTDQGGLSYEKALTISVTDVNETPLNLLLSATITPENVAAGAVIGAFTSTDPDASSTFTYSLVTGTGSTDNAAFSVVGNQLKITASPDFEAKSSYSIRVRTTDQGGLSYEKALTISVTDVNEAPTSLVLSNAVTPENVAAGSVIGSFASIDPDASNTFTYSLVTGTGSTDNAAFAVVGNQLKINALPDFETNSSYSVRVRTTDQGGLSFDQVFTVSITDVNETPTSLVLSNAVTPENIAAGSVIGSLTTTDPDVNNTFTYSLVTGTGSTDNAAFLVVGNQLKINASPDFELKSSYSIRVRTTDQGGLSYEKALTISVTDVNEAPTSIVLSNNTTPENIAAGSIIGNFASTDPDANNTFTYSLVTGTGSTDNAAFSVVGNQLKINASPDFEAKSSYSILVRTTDQGGLSYDKSLVIGITDLNEAPTSLVLSNNVTPENVAAGSVIGTLTSADPDANNTFTYSLVSGTGATDNGAFSIVNNQLKINASPDFETKSSYSVRVRTSDQGGLSYEKIFAIAITDLNEAPTSLILSNSITPENVAAGSVIGILTSADPDANNTFTYSLVSGTGATDNSAFSVVGNQLKINASPDFEAKSSYSVLVRTTDQGGLSYDKAFTVSVADLNEAPTSLVLSNAVTPENVAADSVIGTFTSTDPDINNTFTYSLVSGTGSTDNAAFTIAGNQLKISASPNFEAQSGYSIRVRTTDQGGLSYEKALTIAITDLNEAPTDLSLNPSSTLENVAPGSTIGNFSTTDSDANNTFSYSLVSGTGSTDNAAFSVVNNQLTINASPDFETKTSYSVRVRTTDQGGLSREKALIVSVLNVNEAPTAISLTNASVPENSVTGTIIGQLSTPDPDQGDTQQYTLTDSAGDRFEIIGNTLRVKAGAVLDFETTPSLSIEVKSTDAGGLSISQRFAIALTNVNEAPTDIALSATTIAENTPIGTVIGTLSATDPDQNDTQQYSLVPGTGATDNAAFVIVGNQLQLQTTPNFATHPSYSIRVKATDSGGLSTEKVLSLSVLDTTAPLLSAGLAHDTAPNGQTNTDGLTSDSSIQGQVTDNGTIAQIKAWFDGQTPAQAQSVQSSSNGQFQLSRTQLETIYGRLLSDGQYTLNLQAIDAAGNASTTSIHFTLDTAAPAIAGFNLAPGSDTAPTGDFKTKQSVVDIVGQSEPNAQVKLINTGATLSVDGTGQFQISNIPLTLGDNALTIQITDGAGNTQTVTQHFTRVNGGDVVTDWNAIALEAIRTDRTAPPRAAYILAMVQTTVFDAVDAIDQKYDVFKIDATAAPNASPEAAAVAAAHRILVHYFPHQQAVLDLAYTQSLAKLQDSTSKNDGIALGESVADQMLALRANDGTEAVVAETPSTDLGKWRPTLPKYDGAALPQWPDVETFALVDGAQFRPSGPPALDSAQYAADYNLTQQLGAKNSAIRTADQTQIAKFWADGAGTYTPPGHWNQIAQDAAANSGNSLIDNARLFALLDVSLADSGIAAWDAKYQYDFWRPITAIQQGDADGNALTVGDPTWTPLINTPPFPEYVSGHSTFSGAASTILTNAFGSNYSFTTTSYGLTGITRSFTSFDQAADQAGMSRIYGGIHFNSANQDGLALGRNVGSYVASHYFQPANRSTVLQANLANDTAPVGMTNRDKITSDPTITGKVTGTSVVLKAGLDQTTPTNYQNITAFLAPDGSFTLNAAALSQLNGSALQDGIHTVHFQAFNAQGSVLESQDLAFVLDRGAPSASFEAPTVNAIYSPTAHLKGKIVDTLSQGGAVRYSVDGQAFSQFKADASGQFDQIISPSGLGVGNHQVAVEIYDAAGNMTQSAIAFTVSDQFSEGGTQTNGWGTQTADTLTLYEGNSFEVQKVTPVAVGVSAGTRTLEFDVNPNWDLKDDAAVAQDRLLVYLVDPSNPSHTLLDGGEAGTALFSLSGAQAEYRPGLVHFDGRHVSIDVSSLPVGTTGNLVFQMLNLDGDTGSSVQVLNLTNTVDPTGTPSPIFPVVNQRAIAGPAVSLDSYLSNPDAKVLLSNVHLDPSTGRVLADLRVQNTGTATISSNMAVLFPNLPGGVSLLNASGTHPAGSSYLNLKPALVDGDLKAGATSGAIQVVLNDPNLIQFDLQTVVLTGALTQPPQLQNLGTLNVTAGGRLEVPLTATSPDGGLVTLSLRDANNLPTGQLANGTLTFTPSPTDVGTYHFTLVATSNGLETTQAVTLNVAADPLTTTRVSGVVQNTDQMPLAGILVDVDGSQAVTDAQGRFTVTVALLKTSTLRIMGGMTTGSDYPSIAEKLPLMLEHDVYVGVNNDIARPIYLPKLDYAGGQIVDSFHDAVVTSAKLPGAAVTVKAGTLTDQSGNPFTGVLSITEVPVNLTPAALPENLHPDLVVTIQPGDMKFTTPAPLTLPNRSGYAPGQILDLWSINPTSGVFEIVGKCQVSADGSVINTIEGGIRNSSWHFVNRRPLKPRGQNGDPNNSNPQGCDGPIGALPDTNPFASDVELHSGAVIKTHDLVTYESLGTSRGLTLTYDSLRADPRPIVHFGYQNVDLANVAPLASSEVLMMAKLSFSNNNFTYQVPGSQGIAGLNGGENFWKPKTTQGTFEAALQGDLRSFDSGVYDYTLESGFVLTSAFISGYGGTVFGSSSTVTTGKVIQVNSINSAFGSGWGLSGLQNLIENKDGSILLIDGNGSERLFEHPSGSGNVYQSQGGDMSTLERMPDGTFQRTLMDQTVYKFNAQNQLASTKDLNGNTTQYLYDSFGQISRVIDPVGLETNFTYNAQGKVASIVDPSGRMTRMDYDTAGNLTRITDPDGTARNWEYDADHHVTVEVDKEGMREEDVYDFAGRATKGIRSDGSVIQITPAQVQGLYRPDQTINPFDGPNIPPALSVDTANASYVDASGNVTKIQLDQAGHAIQTLDTLGNQPSVVRNDHYMVTQKYDSRGNATTYSYDSEGRLILVQDAGQSTTSTTGLFSQVALQTGLKPIDILLKDLNGDGKADLITANQDDNSLSIRLGTSQGFAPTYSDVTLPFKPSEILSGDFNKDGFLDLIVSSATTNSVSLLTGQGNGTFGTPISYAVGTAPNTLAVGDLNKDGYLDIITASQSDRTVTLWFGNQAGTLSNRQDIPINNSVAALALGDLDGDGTLDLVGATSDTNQVMWLKGRGNGTFGAQQTLTGAGTPQKVYLADLNSDNVLDVIAANGAQKTFTVWKGLGNGVFSSAHDFQSKASVDTLTLTNLDADNNLDLITTSQTGSVLEVFRGDGTSDFTSLVNYSVQGDPSKLALSDINGDKLLDLAAVNPSENTVSLFEGNGNGTFDVHAITATYQTGSLPSVIAVGDLNGDGDLDVVTANPSAKTISIRFGKDGSEFSTNLDLAVALQPIAIELKDLDEDGKLDIITANIVGNNYNSINGSISVFLANGDGTFKPRQDYVVGTNASQMLVSDLTGDGHLDVVLVDSVKGESTFLQGDGKGQLKVLPSGEYVLGSPSAAAISDVNGDGSADVVSVNKYGLFGRINVLSNRQNGNYEKSSYSDGPGLSGILFADINGDGRQETIVKINIFGIIEVNPTNSYLTGDLYYYNTSGLNVTDGSWKTADLNNDGYQDLVVVDGDVSVFLGRADGTFENDGRGYAKQIYSFSSIAAGVDIADLNGDNILDIVTTAWNSNKTNILYGKEDGTFVQNLPEYNLAQTAFSNLDTTGLSSVGDINNDGNLDLITTNPYGSGNISILLGKSGGKFESSPLTFNTSQQIDNLTLADMNHDGNLDLVTLHIEAIGGGGGYGSVQAAAFASFAFSAASASSNEVKETVSIYLGDGLGGFSSPTSTDILGTQTSYYSNPNARPVLNIADLNGDGKLDVTTTLPGENAFYSLLGQGDGTLGTLNTVSTNGAPLSIAQGDLNQDGWVDAVLTNQNDGQVTILMANGVGTYGAPITLPVGTQLSQLRLADVNKDGNLDILAIDQYSSIDVLLGTGNGQFGAVTTYAVAQSTPNGAFTDAPLNSIQLTDVDSDGNLDIVAGASSGFIFANSFVSVLQGHGDGTFGSANKIQGINMPDTLDLSDLNHDGATDLLITSHDINRAAVYLGKGNGTFLTSSFLPGRSFIVRTGDVNGDGVTDLVGATVDGKAYVLQRLNDGTYLPIHTIDLLANSQDLQLHDIDGDGNLDIVSLYTSRNSIAVQYGRGDGTFGNAREWQVGQAPNSLTIGDINGDGLLDAVTTNDSGTVSILIKSGDDFVGANPLVSKGLLSVVAADFNQDGYNDVAYTNDRNQLSIRYGAKGGSFKVGSTYNVGTHPTNVTVADFNQDLILDLITTNTDDNTVSVLLSKGDGSFNAPLDWNVGRTPTSLRVGDVNGDGYIDVLTGSTTDSSFSVLLGNGDGTFQSAQDFQNTSRLSDFVLADVDRDGDLDAIALSRTNGTFSIDLNRSADNAGGRQVVATKKYSYDSRFNRLTSETDELGHTTLYELDSANGNVLSTTRVVGAVGGSDDVITRYTYTTSGQVDLMTDALGHVTDYDYDAKGHLIEITSAKGTADEAKVHYEYDLAGNKTAEIDGNGNRTTFEYDAMNRLVRSIAADPDGAGPLSSPITTYTYDVNGDLLTMTDARGYTTRNEYDAMMHLSRTIDPLGAQTRYGYDAMGNQIWVEDALGRRTQSVYDARQRLTQVVNVDGSLSTFKYDPDGNLVSTTDANGNATRRIYDTRGRLVGQIDALGNKSNFIYDAGNQLTTQIDAKGNVTRYEYDELGRQSAIVDALGNRTTLAYDKVDNLLTQTDALGQVTRYEYDARNRQISMTDALGGVTRYRYDADGNLLSQTDALNRTTTYVYDALNRQTSVTDALGRTTRFEYDADGNLTRTTDALGRVTQSTYDGLNRQVSETDADGNTTTTTYDGVGNVVSTSDTLGRTTTYAYDNRDRRTAIADSLGNTSTTAYDFMSNVVSTTDALGHTTSYGYDALNRKVNLKDATGQQTRLTYDATGNLTSLTDPSGNATRYRYDALNRETSDTNALGFSRTYRYDAVGNLSSTTDRDGRVRQYSYDGLNRQTQENWLNNAGTAIYSSTATYDSAGQLTAVSDPNSRYTYSYDLAGRLTVVDNTGTPNTPAVVLNYSYDAVNNLTSVIDSINGQQKGTTAYRYDNLNRATRITQSGNGVSDKRIDLGYNKASQTTQMTRYADLNGNTLVAQTSYSYDLSGRLTNLTQQNNGTFYANDQWSYDSNNRITQFVSSDGTSNYSYDSRGELTGTNHTNQANEAYSYDANGNRTNTGYETGANNHLLSDGTFTYTYDNEGNRTSRTNIATGEVTQYIWDYHNHLTSILIKDSSGIITKAVDYTHDVYGQRLAKVIDTDGSGSAPAQTERMVYDRDNIALTFDGTGNQTHRYLYGTGVDQILADETRTSVNWALVDNQGSIRDIIDSQGIVLNHIVYDSFGQVTNQTNTSFDFRYGYTGRERDTETGLNYNRARYYDTATGAFLSEDPLSFAAGDYNLSRYVFNSPTNGTDPSGMFLPLVLGGIALTDWLIGGALLTGIGYEGYQIHKELNRPQTLPYPDAPVDSPIDQQRKDLERIYKKPPAPQKPPQKDEEPNKDPSPFPIPKNPNCDEEEKKDPCSRKGSKIHYLGGSYSMVRNSNIGGEVHHIPAWKSISSSGISLGDQISGFNGYNRAPAICMTIEDHKFTLSHSDQGMEGTRYRARQSILIRQGLFLDAQLLDIQNIRAEFGTKYNQGITQATDYTNKSMTQHPEWFRPR